MNSPKNLKHKPIIEVSDYDTIDLYTDTDAFALSIGKAQYNFNDISLKVWRKNKNKWSRQSEELPIHRVLDLTLLTVATYHNLLTKNNSIQSSLNESICTPVALTEITKYFNNYKNEIETKFKEIDQIINKILK